MLRPWSLLVAILAAISWAAATPSGSPTAIVVCAPGFPSNTAQAQPTMDTFARAVEQAVGWPEGRMEAVYHPILEDGLEALGDERVGLALVPLPLWVEHGRRLGLQPILEVVQVSGEDEVWALLAARDSLTEPTGLAGWELTGVPGYSARFVRELALADWGVLPGDVRISFTRRPVSALRQAAAGERVAVLLDAAQTEALPRLHFASELAVVARSRPMAGVLLCAVGDRLEAQERRRLASAFLRLHEIDGGDELLSGLRIRSFRPLADGRLPAIE